MNRGQRIVVVVALGLALLVLVWGASLLMLDAPNDLTTYTPGESGPQQADSYVVVVDDSIVVQRVALALSALALWTAASLWLLRSRDGSS